MAATPSRISKKVDDYRVDPPQGIGQQMMPTAHGERVTHTVRDGDAVLLPYGYHPVALAPPGDPRTTCGRWPESDATWRWGRKILRISG